jgi:hypothetical protein
MRQRIMTGIAVGFLAVMGNAQNNAQSKAPATASSATKSDAPSQRGIQLRKQPGSVTYDIEVTRDGKRGMVPPDFKFMSGDEFTLRVTLSADSYVYVLNRTLVGSPSELSSNRQIRLVHDAPAGAASQEGLPDGMSATPFTLVYPQSGHRLLTAGKINLLPSSEFKMQMDNNPGAEELVLVVSPTPQNFTGLNQAAKSDSAADVYNRLRSQLTSMAKNTEVDEPPASTRGFELVPIPGGKQQTPQPVNSSSSPQAPVNQTPPSPKPPGVAKTPAATPPAPSCVAAPKVMRQPFLVEIVLAHYPS